MSAQRWRRLATLVKSGTINGITICGRIEIALKDGRVVLHSHRLVKQLQSGPAGGEPVPLVVPGRTELPWAGGAIETRFDSHCDWVAHETIDLDRIVPPLVARAPALGDRFRPLGLEGKSQALADFFRGCRVPAAKRRRTPVVCDQNGILWVVGHRIAERVKLTAASRRTLSLTWISGPV
jgi:tRNA(Ile)-lysidine synthase